MARQVLTLPDVPATLLTQAAGDARYQPVGVYLTQATADVRYLQISNAFTQAQADARYLQSATAATTYLPLAGGTLSGALRLDAGMTFAGDTPLTRTAAGALQLAGATASLVINATSDAGNAVLRFADRGANRYSFQAAGTDDDTFSLYFDGSPGHPAFAERLRINATGTLTLTPDAGAPALTTPVGANVGLGEAPAPWRADLNALQVHKAAFMGAGTGLYLTSNVYYTAAGTVGMTAGGGSQLLLSAQMQFYATQANASGAGAAVTLTERLRVSNAGTLSLFPDAGQPTLSSPSTISVESTASINLKAGVGAAVSLFDSGGVSRVNLYQNQWYPSLDNSTPNGLPANRWTYVAAVAGAINTSLAEAKTDITPLDPVACAQAVLDTDWVSFSYRPPSYAEPPDTEDQAPEDRQRRVDEGRAAHAKMLVETQPIRDQKGYVLGSPDHQTHDLFGLSDRKSASPSTDLAVVACALQHCLLEIAELKARLA